MKRFVPKGFALLAGVIFAAPLAAEDLALVLANGRYENAPFVRSSARAQEMIVSLEQAGFRVIAALDQNSREMQARTAEFDAALGNSESSDRIVIVLSGHVVENRQGSWILGREAYRPSPFTVNNMGVSLQALGDLAARSQGQAVMMIGLPGASVLTGTGIETGIGQLQAPQGVQIAAGDFYAMPELLRNGYLVGGKSFAEVAHMAPETVTVTGFISDAIGLMPAESAPLPNAGSPEEFVFWQLVNQIGTVESYQIFLNSFPHGRYANQARHRIAQFVGEPQLTAEQIEDALGLSRTARRQVQQNLALLGYNPRGVDGIFGRGSRSAIANWQRANGFEDSGYLTGNNISRLQAMANQRAQEIEREERLQQEQLLRQDRSFWRETGMDGSEAGLRAYLRRYPNGVHAADARAGLRAIDRQNQIEREREAQRQLEQLLRQDRQFWRDTGRNGSEAGLRAYLRRYPDGAHAVEARSALRVIDRQNRIEREREAQRQREQLLRQDRQYWRETGKNGEESGLRAYLRRYPEGIHADEARSALREIEQRRQGENARAERVAWDNTRQVDTIAAYRRFLNQYPNGRFAQNAKSRIRALKEAAQNLGQAERDKAEEREIRTTPENAVKIETTLALLGFNPGPVDGNFTNDTRRAIRKFQGANNLVVTGFVSHQTMMQLKAMATIERR